MNSISDLDFDTLFTKRRRDANFAAVFNDTHGTQYALRDHLGTVPLFYRQTDSGPQFSTILHDLLRENDRVENTAIEWFLALGTTKVVPPIHGIQLVPPGTVLCFRKGATAPDVLYQYKFKIIPLPKRREEIVHETERLLVKAIRRIIKDGHRWSVS